jgi:hypothetical protein
MSQFLEWNSLLLQNYFSPALTGQDVWMPTTNVELESIGFHIGGAAGLIEAVKQGPSWLNNDDNIAVKAQKLVFHRSHYHNLSIGYCDPGNEFEAYKGTRAPTYLPYLALWVLAQSEVGTSFYDKVSELTGMPFPSDVREGMKLTWLDLKYWSIDEQGGRFGRFNVNVLGVHQFVGIAKAQAMITGRDIEGISRLFASCKLHPGQNLESDRFIELLEYGANSSYLSGGLKDAMRDLTYRDPLIQMLQARLEFWDGVVAKNTLHSSRSVIRQEEPSLAIDNEISIILKMENDGGDVGWKIGWRVPAIVTGTDYSLKIDIDRGEYSKAKLELYGGTHLYCIKNVNQTKARSALDDSAKNQINATLSYSEIDGTKSNQKFYISNKKIRILTWDTLDPSLRDSMYEREMPIQGPVFLMFSKQEYSNLELILENEEIEHELFEDYSGLPDHWGLIFIANAEKLSLEQRATIIEEEYLTAAKARIRFVGGKSISGLGGKRYEYYDLPIVELEGPETAEIYADGLSFERLDDESHEGSIRRYRFSLDDGSGCAFKVKVRVENEIACTVGFQVLNAGGIASTQQENFSINKFGEVLTNESGLRGASIGQEFNDNFNLETNYFEVNRECLVNSDQIYISKIKEANISCLFLDSLASTRAGSMTFGVARDQIRRLAYKVGLDDIEPGLLVQDLRRRGHVEVETNFKGHMVNIKSVLPTLYLLPIKNGGECFYGICGSLRLAQWTKLEQVADVNLYVENTLPNRLPVVRVGTCESTAIEKIALSAGFRLQTLFPGKKISQWSGSIKEIKKDLKWFLSRGVHPAGLSKLTPGKGTFWEADNMDVDPDQKYELFRHEDPQIPGMRVYKFGMNIDGRYSKHSFIPDSRWGVWAALGAFSDFMKNHYGNECASPWPFHYESETGRLWLPARIEPPFVMGRALALCAGDSPTVIDAVGEEDGESILLREKGSSLIGRVSYAYSAMHTGKWLCYRWVPRDVAHHIAGLLDGELKEI